ncbi:MAG: hypothetical protein ABIO24_10870, partial [Saprospiraceae bacterium]
MLYIWAAWLYPGGSRTEPDATRFSLLDNYWCDLFDVVTPNGQSNPARPVAIVAMLVLTCAFGLLWYIIPRLFTTKNYRTTGIQVAGISAMCVAVFLFTRFHEVVINLS